MRWQLVVLVAGTAAVLVACGARTPLGILVEGPGAGADGGDDAHHRDGSLRDGPISIDGAPAPCVPAAGVEVVAEGQSTNSIAVDGSHAYWVDGSSSGGAVTRTLRRISLSGGAPEDLTPLATGDCWGIAVDDAWVYFADRDGSTVSRAPKTGGPPTVVASGLVQPYGIAIDATHLYAATQAGVFAAPKSGGAVVTGSNVFSTHVAVDAVNVYATAWSGQLLAIPLPVPSGASVNLASELYSYGVAADGTSVYFTAGRDVWQSSPKAFGATSIATGETPNEVAVDDHAVYWTDIGGSVNEVPKKSGANIVLASLPAQLTRSLAIDACNVYFTLDCCTDGGSRIMRVAKQ